MEKQSGRSLRNQFSINLEDADTTQFVPKNIDIRWSNTCQLRCAYCRPEWSTTYARWEGVSGQVSTRKWQDEVLQLLTQHKGTEYKFISLLGGEPLLLKENIKLLELLHENQWVTVLTNLSLDNIESSQVYRELLKIRTYWHVSCEAIKNKMEYIRRNAKWEVTSANYINLQKAKHKDSQLGFHMTYCILSAFSLNETFEWLAAIGPCDHVMSPLNGPAQFAIVNFPKEVKELAIREIDVTLERHNNYLNQDCKNFLTNTKNHLMETLEQHDKFFIELFKEFVKKTDSEVSGYSFASEWPEVAAVLERY
jgi:organic radical activating enzyme